MRKIVRNVIAVPVVALLATAGAGAQGGRGPSTAEERDKALRLIDQVEADPMAFESREAREWLVNWLGEVPDVVVSYCTTPLGSGKDLDEVPAELKMQMQLGQAAYLIRHPEARPDSLEVFMAGVESTIRSYDRLRKAGTVWKVSALEDLKKDQADGKLAGTVEKRAKKCG
jgi:hypothetical protein